MSFVPYFNGGASLWSHNRNILRGQNYELSRRGGRGILAVWHLSRVEEEEEGGKGADHLITRSEDWGSEP